MAARTLPIRRWLIASLGGLYNDLIGRRTHLGAAAVMIGRPYVYGLAVAGAAGVERAAQILKTELMMAMALVGVRSIEEIDHQAIWE